MGIPTGLDYSGVAAYAQLRGIVVSEELLAGLQMCEAAALHAMSDKASKEKRSG